MVFNEKVIEISPLQKGKTFDEKMFLMIVKSLKLKLINYNGIEDQRASFQCAIKKLSN